MSNKDLSELSGKWCSRNRQAKTPMLDAMSLEAKKSQTQKSNAAQINVRSASAVRAQRIMNKSYEVKHNSGQMYTFSPLEGAKGTKWASNDFFQSFFPPF